MFCVLGCPILGSIKPDIARKVVLEGTSAWRVSIDWYASWKLQDQGMTRCASSITQNPNLFLKILDLSIDLKAGVLILSRAQPIISCLPDIASFQRLQGGSYCSACLNDSSCSARKRIPLERCRQDNDML